MSNSQPHPGAPRWLKVFGIVVVALIVAAIIVGHLLGFRPSHSVETPKHAPPSGGNR